MITNSTTTAMKYASYPAVLFVASYLKIDAEIIGILFILLVLDVITGILKEWLLNPKGLSSRVGIIGILSKLLTLLIPLTIALVSKGSGIYTESIVKLVDMSLVILVVYEGWSVLGNIGQIRAKDKTISEYDAISFVIKKIQDTLKAVIEPIYNYEAKGSGKVRTKPEDDSFGGFISPEDLEK